MRESWEIRELGEVCKFFRGLTYSKGDEVEKSSKKVLRSNNIDLESNTLVLEEMKYLREDFDIEDDKIVKSNSILICMSNGSKQHIGKVAFIKEPIDYAFGGFMGLIFPDKSICAKYIYYACTSSLFKHFILGIGNGIGITNLRFTDLSNFTLPVPPLSEQERIVAELDCLSSVIEKQKELLKELDNLAQSTFYTMFGDPITNEKGWKIERLGNMCEISSSKRIYAHEYCESGIPFYRGKEITEKGKGNDVSVELYISKERYQELKSKYGVPNVGDILITAVGTIGNIWVVDSTTPFYFKDGNVLWLQPTKEINPTYFKKLLHCLIDKYKESMANGCAYSALTIVNLKEMQTNKIPYALQQEFASKIEAIEKQKKLIKQSLSETETLFNSRMDYYFN